MVIPYVKNRCYCFCLSQRIKYSQKWTFYLLFFFLAQSLFIHVFTHTHTSDHTLKPYISQFPRTSHTCKYITRQKHPRRQKTSLAERPFISLYLSHPKSLGELGGGGQSIPFISGMPGLYGNSLLSCCKPKYTVVCLDFPAKISLKSFYVPPRFLSQGGLGKRANGWAIIDALASQMSAGRLEVKEQFCS